MLLSHNPIGPRVINVAGLALELHRPALVPQTRWSSSKVYSTNCTNRTQQLRFPAFWRLPFFVFLKFSEQRGGPVVSRTVVPRQLTIIFVQWRAPKIDRNFVTLYSWFIARSHFLVSFELPNLGLYWTVRGLDGAQQTLFQFCRSNCAACEVYFVDIRNHDLPERRCWHRIYYPKWLVIRYTNMDQRIGLRRY